MYDAPSEDFAAIKKIQLQPVITGKSLQKELEGVAAGPSPPSLMSLYNIIFLGAGEADATAQILGVLKMYSARHPAESQGRL